MTTKSDASPSDAPTWTLADRLRKARLHAKLRQSELAHRLGLGESTGARIPLKPVAQMWAQICDVPFEWLDGGVYNQDGGPRRRRPDQTAGYTESYALLAGVA